ncbi:hypothetical protein [Kribbella ginsengisoli]|uniref:hypothetical protein n=1 Tax=Kribbella ginsengisoli TaxID=363865 RepID=UPI0031E3B7A9
MEDLQRAVYASVEIMAAAPARIAGPMLGAAYRACLGFSQVTLFPVGSPYTGKTSLTSVVAQHYDSSSSFEDMAGVGAGEDAGTTNAIGDLRFLAGDILFPLDDLAPDKGPEKAAERLNAIARSQYNRKGKVRMDRKTNVKVSHPPRGLPVVTGEQSTSMQSAETRLATVRFLPGDLDLTPNGAVAQLSTGTAPQDRASLIAAMVRYYASRHPLTAWLSETRAELSIALAEDNPDQTDEQRNADLRASGVVADLAVGWRAMLDMATELGAISSSMAAELWASAWEGLLEAKRRMLDGRASRTPADRLREMVNALLLGRRIAFHSREGGTPVNPEAYGWELNSFDGGYRLAGEPVGWTDGKTVWLLPSSLFPHLERQANAEKEPMGLTKESMAQRLADAGVIKLPPREDGKPVQRNAVQRRMGGKPQWVWEMNHDWLFPPEEPEDGDPGKEPAPLPDAPTPPPAPGRAGAGIARQRP